MINIEKCKTKASNLYSDILMRQSEWKLEKYWLLTMSQTIEK